MDYDLLKRSVAEDAAIRRRQRLQPVGGQGDKIFPPTYPPSDLMKRVVGDNAPPRHVLEQRMVGSQPIWCALVDSVQSQANRLEEALSAIVKDGSVAVPHVVVDFRNQEGLTGIVEITSFEAPHRVYDAILRDSLLGEDTFPQSTLGKSLAAAKMSDASALLEISPTALLFGSWNSTGEGGGLGAKFPRALVSEIAAFGVVVEDAAVDQKTGEVEMRTAGRRSSSRIDPIGALNLKGKKGSSVKIWKSDTGWDVDQHRAGKGAREAKSSEVNHGNITPSVQALGITCSYLEQVAVISFAGLRRLNFGGGERDAAGRAYLAALGLLALAEQDARGYALRSRCDLVCEGRAPLQRVLANGETPTVDLDRAAARALYSDAFEAAKRAGLALRDKPVRLVPQDKLVAIVRESQRLALAGKGGDAEEGQTI